MKYKYVVNVTVASTVQITVEADDEDEAEEKALQKVTIALEKTPQTFSEEMDVVEAEVQQKILCFDQFKKEEP